MQINNEALATHIALHNKCDFALFSEELKEDKVAELTTQDKKFLEDKQEVLLTLMQENSDVVYTKRFTPGFDVKATSVNGKQIDNMEIRPESDKQKDIAIISEKLSILTFDKY